jgi:hypothetical protein
MLVEVLAGFADPRSELVAFVDGHEGIDEDGVSLAGDQRGCRRGPRGDAAGIFPGPPLTGRYPLLKTSMVRVIWAVLRSNG